MEIEKFKAHFIYVIHSNNTYELHTVPGFVDTVFQVHECKCLFFFRWVALSTTGLYNYNTLTHSHMASYSLSAIQRLFAM